MQTRGAKAVVRRIVSGACLVALAIMPLSCGKSEPKSGARYPVFPVQGEIFVNGKPGTGIEVKLHPVTPLPQLSESRGTIAMLGNVDTEGVYKISTYDSFDGAPAGKYNISLFAKVKSPDSFSKRDEDNPGDRFEGKYADAAANAKNDPEHFTVEVKEDPKGKDAEPVKIPRLNIDQPDFWPPEEKKPTIEVPATP